MALRLTLKPRERVIIGGAALRNGDGRIELFVENEVPVLRESDILSPGAVRTPCQRIYLALQLAYVDAARRAEHADRFRALAAEVAAAAPSCRPLLDRIAACLEAGRYYQALKVGRRLLDHEREILSHVL